MPMPPRIAIPVPTTADPSYNRQSWPSYAEAIRLSGGDPVEIPLTVGERELVSLAKTCQGILLPGSPADVDPARYGQDRIPETASTDAARERTDIHLLEHGTAHGLPILTICFGTQMLNVWRGGTLIQDLTTLPVNHKAGRAVAVAHNAAVAPESVLGAILTAAESEEAPEQEGFLRLPVNSSHHQALATPGAGLRITARCPQDAVIEAVEAEEAGSFLLGVQWHPERSFAISPASRALFTRFVAEASR